MAIKILARIPANNGMQIRCDATYTHVVGPEACHVCETNPPTPATVVVRGETDSSGMDLVAYCDACLAKAIKEESSYVEALDVVDRPGHFVVSEMTNVDGYGDFFGRFTSFRAANAYLRRCELAAEKYSGLYPNRGVREMSKEEADKMVESNRLARLADEAELDLLQAAQDDAYDQCEWDDYEQQRRDEEDDAAFDRSKYNI